MLNRNDAKGTPVAWSQDNVLNYWEVASLEEGVYDIEYHFIDKIKEPGNLHLKMYPYNVMHEYKNEMDDFVIENFKIKKGSYRFEPFYQTKKGKYIFPFYVSVKRIDK